MFWHWMGSSMAGKLGQENSDCSPSDPTLVRVMTLATGGAFPGAVGSMVTAVMVCSDASVVVMVTFIRIS